MRAADEAPASPWDRLCRPALVAPLLAGLGLAVSLWFMNRGLPPNDEGALLTNAAKILQGGVFYRDIDAYPFPAAHYLLAIAMRLFGESVAVARALAILVFEVVLLALYAAALRLLDRPRAALFGLCLLGYKILAWPAFTAYTYSDVSFAGACIAVAALLARLERGGRWQLALAGAGAGASIAAKQNLGLPVAAAIAAALLLPGLAQAAPRGAAQRLRDAGVFALGAAAVLLPGIVWFASQGLLGRLLESGLLRPFTGYLPTSSVSFLTPLAWWQWGSLRDMPAFAYFPGSYWTLLTRSLLPPAALQPLYWGAGELFARLFYSSLPLLFAAAWLRARREPAGGRGGRLRAAALLALAATLSAFPRADFFHLVSVHPLLLLLGFALLPRGSAAGPGALDAITRRLAVAVALALALASALAVPFVAQFQQPLRLPRAELRVHGPTAWVEPIVRYLDEEIPPGEPLFVYGHEAYYYFLADRYTAWPFAQLYPGQEGSDGGRALVEQLERRPPRLIVRGMLNWPALPLLPRYAPHLEAWVGEQYEPDPELARRHPLPAGVAPARGAIAVLRRRAPPAD
jgi:hypothetical protein